MNGLKKALKWCLGAGLVFTNAVAIFVMLQSFFEILFSPERDDPFHERLLMGLVFLAATVPLGYLVWVGWRMCKKLMFPVPAAEPAAETAHRAENGTESEPIQWPDAAAVPAPQPTPALSKVAQVQKLLALIYAYQNGNAGEAFLAPLLKDAAQRILELDQLYLAMDADFNCNFPFVDRSGSMEFFTDDARAQYVGNVFEERYGLRTIIRKYERKDFAELFAFLHLIGCSRLRVDNGFSPVEMHLKEFWDGADEKLPLVDDANCGLRHLFVRTQEYRCRLQKIRTEDRGTETERALQSLAMTMEGNGYQTMAGSLLYVFAPGPRQEDVTFYTPKAMEKARKLLEEQALPEERLLALGAGAFRIYSGSLNLRVTNRPGETAVKDGFVCAFTESQAANAVWEAFARMGCDDNLLVITWEELMGQAVQCAGILLDMPTYSMQIHTSEFEKIMTYASIPGPIVVKIRDEKNQKEEKEETEKAEQ